MFRKKPCSSQDPIFLFPDWKVELIGNDWKKETKKYMQRTDSNPNPTPTEKEKSHETFREVCECHCDCVMFITTLPARSTQKKIDTSKQQTEQTQPSQSQQQLNPATESRDPHSHPSPKKVNLVITRVRITRHPDRGKIGIHATVKKTSATKAPQKLFAWFFGNSGSIVLSTDFLTVKPKAPVF